MTKIRKVLAYQFLGIFLFGAACSGTSLVDQVTGAGSSEVGVLEIMAVQHLRDGEAGEITPENTKIVFNDLGYKIEVAEAVIHFHDIKLVSEGEDPRCISGLDTQVDLHRDQDLLSEDLFPHPLAAVPLNKNFFCQFEIALGTEEHAHGIKFAHPEQSPLPDGDHDHSEDGLGYTIYVAGTWSKDTNTEDFALMGMEPIVVQGPFKAMEDGEVIDHALHFTDGEDLISVLFGVKYDLIFDGVDFQDQSQKEQMDQIYRNLPRAVHQHTGFHHGSDEASDHHHGS